MFPVPYTWALIIHYVPVLSTWTQINFSLVQYFYLVTKLYETFRGDLSLALLPNQIFTFTIV